MDKVRLDLLLTQRDLASSRSRAQEMIRSGIVFVSGKQETKPSYLCDANVEITVEGNVLPYVSRGGLKLEKALSEFQIDPEGMVCADCGASTGGFTDCLLQKGAKKVYAIDVGTDQLAEVLRQDSRVVSLEQTNIRHLTSESLGGGVDLVVSDLSFISLRTVFPAIYGLLNKQGRAICLVKPQFEAGKAYVGKKGVVKDAKVHKTVLDSVCNDAKSFGFSLLGMSFSPITGPEGNIEFLIYLGRDVDSDFWPDTKAIVDMAHKSLKR